MQFRFSRVAARIFLVAGAAMVTLPLTTGLASADAPPSAPWRLAGGGFHSQQACIDDGNDYISNWRNQILAFQCWYNGGTWDMYVIPAG